MTMAHEFTLLPGASERSHRAECWRVFPAGVTEDVGLVWRCGITGAAADAESSEPFWRNDEAAAVFHSRDAAVSDLLSRAALADGGSAG